MHVHSDDYRDTCCKIIIIIIATILILAIAGLLDIARLPKISEQIILELDYYFGKNFGKKQQEDYSEKTTILTR